MSSLQCAFVERVEQVAQLPRGGRGSGLGHHDGDEPPGGDEREHDAVATLGETAGLRRLLRLERVDAGVDEGTLGRDRVARVTATVHQGQQRSAVAVDEERAA